MTEQESNHPSGASQVRRRIKIPALTHAADALSMERALTGLPGVHKVRADLVKQRISVIYDITATNLDTVIDRLHQVGFPPLDNWWSRRKLSWYRFTEENARVNAKTSPAACCNKPPNLKHR